jgi:hypothetical protein
MRETDPFAPDRWKMDADSVETHVPTGTKQRKLRPLKSGRFLKGPVPWHWLRHAMMLRGKALAVGLILWREAGCQKSRTVYFSLAHAAAEGIPTTTARRAIRALERAGLVTICRKPGHGLEVMLCDLPGSA